MTATELRELQRDIEHNHTICGVEFDARVYRAVQFAADVMEAVDAHEFNSGQHVCHCMISGEVGDLAYKLHREMTP
jgi:hypothetical protein